MKLINMFLILVLSITLNIVMIQSTQAGKFSFKLGGGGVAKKTTESKRDSGSNEDSGSNASPGKITGSGAKKVGVDDCTEARHKYENGSLLRAWSARNEMNKKCVTTLR